MKNKYVYYCDDCKCFVQENHRCQQWSTVHMIPQDAIEKLLEMSQNANYVACQHKFEHIHNSAFTGHRCKKCGKEIKA